MRVRTDEEGHWKEFIKYCEEVGKDKDDWNDLWECWNAALDARDDQDYGNRFGIDEVT